MTQYSYPWSGTVLGDAAVLAPYSDQTWQNMFYHRFNYDRTLYGVLTNYYNGLRTTGVVSPIQTATGIAVVDGLHYYNDAPVQTVVANPAVATRIDRLVLRKVWATQEVRLTLIAGVEGAGAPPAMTQIDGNTWDIPLYRVSITIAGAITLTDERYFIASGDTQERVPCSEGRLTLSSGVPASTADVLNSANVYFTPYIGDTIQLWNGYSWRRYTFTEISAGLAGLVALRPCDVFIYDNLGVLTLSLLNWNTAVARATSITQVPGTNRWYLTGSPGYLYLGTVCGDAVGGQADDGVLFRGCWNHFNRVPRRFYFKDATANWNWVPGAGAGVPRQMNNSVANQVEFVLGIDDTPVYLYHSLLQYNNALNWTNGIGIGLDSVTPASPGSGLQRAGSSPSSTGESTVVATFYNYIGAVGYHYLAGVEYGSNGMTTTFYAGDWHKTEGYIMG